MGLFKRWTDKEPKASKAQLVAFKARLKYGEDAQVMYDTYREHYKQYREGLDQTNELLIKILKPKLSDKMHCWTTLEVEDYISHNDKPCEESPVSKHVYLYHYGDKNPNRDDPRECMCCGKLL